MSAPQPPSPAFQVGDAVILRATQEYVEGTIVEVFPDGRYKVIWITGAGHRHTTSVVTANEISSKPARGAASGQAG